ncbi:MAG: PAS domain S-box protein [Wolinella sp.]
MKIIASIPYLLRISVLGLVLGSLLVCLVSAHLNRERERVFGTLVNKEIELQRDSLTGILHFHRHMSEDYYHAFIEPKRFFSRFPDLFSVNEHDSLSARLALSNEIAPIYDLLKTRDIDNIAFYSTDNRIVYRAHIPEIAGENVSHIDIFVRANDELVPQHGFVIGTTTVGYKSFFPVIDNGKHIGGVELGISFPSILKKLQKHSAHQKKEYFLVLKDSQNMERMLQNTQQKSFVSAFGDGWFLLEDSEEPDKLSYHLDIIEKMRASNPISLKLTDEAVGQVMDDDLAIAIAIPVREYSGEIFAQLIVLSEDASLLALDSYYQQLANTLQILIVAAMIWLIWFLYTRGVRDRKQRRWELVSSKMTDGLFILNSNGKIIYANNKMCEILGYSEVELLENGSHELFHAHQGNRFLRESECPIIGTLKTGTSYEGREQFRRKDGSLFAVQVSSYLLETEGEEREKTVVAIFRDISERVRVESLMEIQQNLSKRLEKIANNLEGFFFEYTIDIDGKDKFTYVSLGIEELLGFSAYDVEHNSALVWDRIDKSDADRLLAMFKRPLALVAPNNRFCIVASSGELRYIEINATPSQEGRIIRWYGYMRDITSVHLIEEKLRESQQRWEFALEGSNDGIWDWKIASDELFLSHHLCTMLGYSEKDLCGGISVILSRVEESSRERVRNSLYDYIKSGDGQYVDEYCVIDGDGACVWILTRGIVVERGEGGEPTRMIGVHTDITERKQLEQSLSDFNSLLVREVEYELAKQLESERSFRMIFENSPEGYLILDCDGRILESNLAAAHMLGVEPDQMIGRGIFEGCDNSCDLHCKTPSDNNGERIYRSASGKEVRIEATFITMHKDDEERIFTIWRDVTEIHELEQAHEREQAYLIQQSKQAELGSMIGAITHQWKQPLNVLSILLQNMEIDAQSETLECKHVLDDCVKMLDMVNFMATTIEDFRTFFKPAKDKENFSVFKAISSVHNLLSSEMIKADIDFEIRGEEDVSAYGYSGEFKQVALNILNNAKDALSEHVISNARIMVEISKEDSWVVVRISDNGGGIAPHLLPDKIFEPFFSTKGKRGTGIGLSLAKVIIEEKMGGGICAYNENDGAIFEIRLLLGGKLALQDTGS